MEILARIFYKILNTTSVSSINIVHPESVNNFSITKENDEINDQGKQPSNNTQQRNYF